MSEQADRVQAAANKIRREGMPPEAVEHVAVLLERHRAMEIGPADEGGWPKGWIAVDQAQNDLTDAVLGDRQ